jgi:MerR family transcriptional regulator, light-induced transcriptional regulator
LSSRHSARSRRGSPAGERAPSGPSLPIAAVERDTGLSKDTLRIWERRYGFPRPLRDPHGERVYPATQIDKLRLVKRLLDQGHRPGKLIASDVAELEALVYRPAAAVRGTESVPADEGLQAMLDLIKRHRIAELRSGLAKALLRMGLARFVADLLAPLNHAVGEAWARGQFEVFEEHLYTESAQVVLRSAIRSIPAPNGRPRVLLTTLPQEAHGIGILMAEAMLALDGARCVSLGVQTPVRDIVLAAEAQQVDIVALSFTAVVGPRQVLAGLAELRGRLAPAVEVWAGGTNPVLQRRPPPGVRVLRTLDDIAPALAEWRAVVR